MPPKRVNKSPSGRAGSPKLEVPLLFGNTKPVQYTRVLRSPKNDQKSSPKGSPKLAQSTLTQTTGQKRKTRSRRYQEEEEDEDEDENEEEEEEVAEIVTKKSRTISEIVTSPNKSIKKGTPSAPILLAKPNPVEEQIIKGPFSRTESPQPPRRESSPTPFSASKSKTQQPQLYAGLTPSASRSPVKIPTPKILTGSFSQVQEAPRNEYIPPPFVASKIIGRRSTEKPLPAVAIPANDSDVEILRDTVTDSRELPIADFKKKLDAFIIAYGDYVVFCTVLILGVAAMMVNFITSAETPTTRSSSNDRTSAFPMNIMFSIAVVVLVAGYMTRSALTNESLLTMAVNIVRATVKLVIDLLSVIREVASKSFLNKPTRSSSPRAAVGVKRTNAATMLFGGAATAAPGGPQTAAQTQRTGVRFAENVGYSSSASQSSESRRPGTPYSKPRSVSIQPTKTFGMETMTTVYKTLGPMHSLMLVIDVFLILVFLFLRIARYSSLAQYATLLLAVLLHPSLAVYLHRRSVFRRQSALVECIAEVCKSILRINIGKPYAVENLKMHLVDKIKSKEWQSSFCSFEGESGEVINMSKVLRSEFLAVWEQAVDAVSSDSRYSDNDMIVDGSKQRCLVAKPSAKLPVAPTFLPVKAPVPIQRHSYSGAYTG